MGMTGQSIEQMAARIAALMEDRLGIRGETLSQKLRRGGRALPARVRHAAAELAEAAEQMRHPRLAQRVDRARIQRAYDRCLHHLRPIGAGERRWDYLVMLAARSGLAILAALGLVIAALVWRGFV